jgi:serine/threonine protein phosphatase PrpC
MVSRLLPTVVSKHLKEGKPIVEAYAAAMEEIEDALKKRVSTAGTCVCSCLIAGPYVWCSNLGDCRAALIQLQVSEDGKPPAAPKVSGLFWLSRDHKASAPEEMKRIADAGGKVVDGRVEGLEPSRTLGDFDVKAQVAKGVISIVPEVRRHVLCDGHAPAQAILVCATDGVWDCISGQDVCDLVHARKELAKLQADIGVATKPSRQPLKDLAEDLVQFSIARGSRDDCTAIVCMISVPRQGSK